jgi:NodT family efflux transporter outer membrane factor (OMF) lipoprotein
MRWIRILIIAGLAAGCVVGPKYNRPTVPSPPAYKELGDWKAGEPNDQVSRGKWWEIFEDAQLNRLEDAVSAANQNVAAAAANVEAARAITREARAQYYPVITADPSIAGSRLATGLGRSLGINFTTYSFPLEASWEPDLFGRVRNTVAASRFSAQARAADLENVQLSAQAELAAEYFALRSQDNLKQLLDATVVSYQDALDVARARYTGGLDSDESVAQAEAQLKGTQAEDINVTVLRAQYEHAIAVLTGQPPETFSIPAAVSKLISPAIPVGVPSQLLERRPDIASAERSVAQANAQIGVAKSAFFPQLLLSATGGFQSVAISQWFDWPSRVWSVGPAVAQTLFDGGLRRATVQQYEAVYDETVANYRQTVLTAFQQVEDNLAAVRILEQVIQQQDSAVESAARSLSEADVRYRAGIDPYLNVIAAQTILLNDQEAAVTFREQQMAASVQLVRALGGGWNVSQLH